VTASLLKLKEAKPEVMTIQSDAAIVQAIDTIALLHKQITN
jgi:hypothetical protein